MTKLSPIGANPGRGGTLDVLRFAAAFFVVLFHYGGEAPVALDSIHPVFFRGYLATDFFLMLSGYVLGRAYGRSIEEGRVGPLEFLSRRIARIWPAHLIVLALMVLVVVASGVAGRFVYTALPKVPGTPGARRTAAVWWLLHVPVAAAMFVLAVMHVAGALYYASFLR